MVSHSGVGGAVWWMIRVFAAICLLAAFASEAAADRAHTLPMDAEEDCLELVPERFSHLGLTDDGRQVALETLVLLDGVNKRDAAAVFELVAKAYAPLEIMIKPTFRKFGSLSLPRTALNPDELIQASKDRVGGERPPTFDVVYTLSTREFENSIAGKADCIGGVRYPARAFAVGRHVVDSEYSVDIGPFTFLKYRSAKIAAHEIGHLLGAVHEYANCVEGDHSEPTDEPGAECTVMFPDAFYISFRFGTLDGGVARGHALGYAAP